MEKKGEIRYGEWYECCEGNMPEDILGTALEIDGYCCTREVLIHASSSLRYKWQDGVSVGYCHSNYISQHRCKGKGSDKWHWEYSYVRPTHWLAIPPHTGNYDWLLDAPNKEELLKRLMI